MTLEPVLQAAQEGFLQCFSWPNILYPVTGTLLASMFAITPGLSGVTLMALAIPFTFGWEPLPVMLLFGAFLGGATFMGSVTAILFGIPGTSANVATAFDGYPMAQQGRARTAIACSASASALGSTCGIVLLILLIPWLREIVLAVGPPEYLMLAVWGLTTLAVLTQGAVIKGLAMACLGLLLSFTGLDPRTAELRYTFGSPYLHDGLDLVPVFLGIFALAQVIELAVSGRRTISGRTRTADLPGGVREGIASVFRHVGLLLRSSIIGTVVGIIPGIGAAVASFLAYDHAARTARHDRDRFGHGDIRGVLAAEAANDAKDGGSLLPTLSFGIPGGAATAVLLAMLTVHGLVPGQAMLTDHLSLVFALIWSLFLSNWLTSIIGLAAVTQLARLTTVPIHLLTPPIVVLVLVGAHIYQGRIGDVVVAVVFGLFGYLLTRYGWPRIPLVIGLVFGPLFETNLHLTLRLQELGRIDFWSRPVAMTLLGLTVVSLGASYFRAGRRSDKRSKEKASRGPANLAFTVTLIALSGILFYLTLGFGRVAQLVPEKIVIPLMLLLFVQAVLDLRGRVAGRVPRDS